MTSDLPADYAQLNDWLRNNNRFLVVTHQRPDGDAIGSAQALTASLRALGKHCHTYFIHELPPQYESFVDDDTTLYDEIDLSRIDKIIAVDCANGDRLAIPNWLSFQDLGIPSANIDHHISNESFATVNLVDVGAAATSEVLANLFREFKFPVTPQIASMLLVGIVTDCGSYRFNNTTSGTMRSSAWLMDQGGEYHKVMEKMYFSEPLSKMRLQGRVLEAVKMSHGNRVARFSVTDELLDSCGATQDDAENLVDVVRCIDGVEIVCRMQQLDDNVRFSLRSINPARPIIGIAKEIGGGGHALAAGATMEHATLEMADARFLELAEGLFNG